ncbi:hypothetical protein GCM10028808_56190 [Spirosoma migulaei]
MLRNKNKINQLIKSIETSQIVGWKGEKKARNYGLHSSEAAKATRLTLDRRDKEPFLSIEVLMQTYIKKVFNLF